MMDVDDDNRKERWGFPTQSRAKGPFPLLDSFKDKLANLIKNIEFKPNTNEFQKKIRKDISRIDKNQLHISSTLGSRGVMLYPP